MLRPLARQDPRSLRVFLLVAVATIAGLFVLGRADAAIITSRSVSSDVVTINGYDVSFTAFSAPGFGDSLTITLQQVDDNGTPGEGDDVTRTERYTFPLPEGSVVIAANLKSASIDTKTRMGKFGKVKVNFTAVGPLEKDRFTCGSSSNQDGNWVGQFNFKPNQSPLPRRMTRGAFPGTLTETRIKVPCETPDPDCFYSSSLGATTVDDDGATASLFVFKSRTGADYQASFTDAAADSAPATITHAVSSSVPKSAFKFVPNLKTGKFQPVNIKHLKGTLQFLANQPLQVTENDCGKNKFRLGGFTGNLTVTTLTGNRVINGPAANGNLSNSTRS